MTGTKYRYSCECAVCRGPNKGNPDAQCTNQMQLPDVPEKRTTQLVARHGRTFEVETLNSAPPPRKRHHKRFTQVPGVWEEMLGKVGASGSTYAVAIVLLYEAWTLANRGYKPIVKLTNVMLKRVRVGRRGKRTALMTLERLKLVSVERRANRNPLVTVCFFDSAIG